MESKILHNNILYTSTELQGTITIWTGRNPPSADISFIKGNPHTQTYQVVFT